MAYEVALGARSWPGWPRRAASPWPTRPSTSRSCSRWATRARPSCRCSSTCTPRATSPIPRWRRRWRGRKAREGGADLLYVGKISPHKAPHDLVKMLDVLRRTDDPAARLHLVGSPLGETYEPALRGVHRRARSRRRRQPRRLGQRRGARGLLPGGRRLRDGLGPRGVLRAPGRGHGPRRAHRGLRRRGRSRDGGGAGPGAARQVARALRRRRGPRARATRPAPGTGRRRAGAGGRLRPGRLTPPLRGAGAGGRRPPAESLGTGARPAAAARPTAARQRSTAGRRPCQVESRETSRPASARWY